MSESLLAVGYLNKKIKILNIIEENNQFCTTLIGHDKSIKKIISFNAV